MTKVIMHHGPKPQRIVRISEASLRLLRPIKLIIEKEILGGFKVTRRHRERADYCHEKHPNYWCAHSELSRSGIGQYRLTQDNKVL
jgi:hypothetical protein